MSLICKKKIFEADTGHRLGPFFCVFLVCCHVSLAINISTAPGMDDSTRHESNATKVVLNQKSLKFHSEHSSRFMQEELDFGIISPVNIIHQINSINDRKKPDLGGRQGLADASDVSKHKNRIKTIGVQFFKEDSPAVFNQDKSWQETYGYDESVGYHWHGKSSTGLGTMNMLVKEYITGKNQSTTVIAG